MRAPLRRLRVAAVTAAGILALAALGVRGANAQEGIARVGDLTHVEGDVPIRLSGYGLVVGLNGTGDRTFGSSQTPSPTVRSVVNLLSRFHIEIPVDRLRLRNVAAVLVTAEISPYARPGAHFEVRVSALGDATSLKGGTLWITPLVTDPDAPPSATAQGALFVQSVPGLRGCAEGGNAGRIPDGGLLEAELPVPPPTRPRLLLQQPDLGTAARIAGAINDVFGAGTASVDDPGAVTLKAPSSSADSLAQFLAGVDTLSVRARQRARVVINSADGSVVVGGSVRIGTALISNQGLTVQIGGDSTGTSADGLLRMASGASVHDVTAGLRAAGAAPAEVAAVLDALRACGALQAELVIR